MPPKPKERVGTIGLNKFGSTMQIIQYNRCDDVLVKFLDSGYLVNTTWGSFNKGEVKNVFDKSVYGLGYLGKGKHNAYIDTKTPTPQYRTWIGMMTRCYSKAWLKKRSTYKGCKVTEEWHNFQTFATWYDQHYYEINEEKMHLDKDILVKGNKIYSPETCVFVPIGINSLFTKTNAKRGVLPIGVSRHGKSNKFVSHCMNSEGKKINLGYHESPEEAFLSYKKFKENLIEQIAEKYKDNIPTKLYDAMINYIVDIND